MDTASAIQYLSRSLHLSHKLFGFSGAKDKRAQTFQRVSLYRGDWSQVEKLNTHGRVSVSSPERKPDKLWLGAHRGNYFKIVVREVSHWGVCEDKLLANIRSVGFINFYGPQRFGTAPIATHEIGIEVLLGKLDRAIGLIFLNASQTSPKFANATRAINLPDIKSVSAQPGSKGVFSSAAAELNFKFRTEKGILLSLASEPHDYQRAWMTLPRNTRSLYVHAVQSWVWNCVASERIRCFGSIVVVGDLMLPNTGCQHERTESDLDLDTSESSHNDTTCASSIDKPQVVTRENIEKCCITDIVLPLPGSDPGLLFPEHHINRMFYERVLAQLGCESIFTTQAREYNIKGSYRYLIVKPDKMDFSTEELTTPENREIVEESKPMRSLHLSFALPPGSYATSLLREVFNWGGM